MSNVSIKLLREGAKLPTRGSAFAAGYDLYACLDGDKELIIPPHATAMLPTGLSFALPEGTFGAVVARSGLASKQGLRPANCLGVIDSDYRGMLRASPCTTSAVGSRFRNTSILRRTSSTAFTL